MATGTTADFVLTRNELIASALRKCKAWPEDGNPALHKIREAVRALNLLIRAESLQRTGLAKSLYATDTVALSLSAGRYVYGTDEGLSASVEEIIAVALRDTSGGDTPIDWITTEKYEALVQKNDTGDPLYVYLKKARLLSDQKLYVWPAPSSIGTSSDTVIQSDVEYTCILKHTSATENKPGSGPSWQLFWKIEDDAVGSADTWVTSTAYENGPTIILTFKRPLYDFDGPYDNPDFPAGWSDYLIYKLALRLAPEYGLGAEDRQLLKSDLAQIEADVFPSSRPHTSKMHNFAEFF